MSNKKLVSIIVDHGNENFLTISDGVFRTQIPIESLCTVMIILNSINDPDTQYWRYQEFVVCGETIIKQTKQSMSDKEIYEKLSEQTYANVLEHAPVAIAGITDAGALFNGEAFAGNKATTDEPVDPDGSRIVTLLNDKAKQMGREKRKYGTRRAKGNPESVGHTTGTGEQE